PRVAVWRVDNFKRGRLSHLLHFGGVVFPSDKALHGINGIGRISHSLAFGYLSHQTLALVSKTNHARRRPSTFFVRDNLNRSAFQNRDTAIGRSQVYADRFSHFFSLRCCYTVRAFTS